MTPEFTTGQIRPIECVKEGWTLIKDDYWILFGVSIVGALIAGVTVYVLLGAMVCGIFICYLKKFDGEKVVFEDLFKGFQYFGRTLLLTVIFVVPIVVYFIGTFTTLYLPLIMQAAGGGRIKDNDILTAFLVALAIDVVIALVMVSIHSLLIFSFPLVVDRGLSSIDAIKLSARAAFRNLGGIGGLIVVNFLLALAGELAFCVGLYLIIPILTASNLVAYRKVFPRPTTRILEPPSPAAYPDLA